MYLDDKADVIVNYLSDNRYNQAVLINGAWGSGKTYFVNEVLTQKLTDKDYIVIRYSLYGKNSCEQISKDIEYKILINLCNNKTKIPTKVLEFIPSVMGMITKKNGIELEDLASTLEKIEVDKSNIVIIFDDLERTTSEINDVLGLINSYVETEQFKVIIVANENEIGSSRISTDLPSKFSIAANTNIILPDDDNNSENQKKKSNDELKYISYDNLISRAKTIFSNDIIYNSIKEKLVGLSITINADFHQLYGNIVTKYSTISSKDFLYKHKGQVIDILQMQECQNLRTLIFGIITFDKIYSSIITLKAGDSEYNKMLDKELLEILRYVIFESILHRTGKDKISDGKSSSNLHLMSIYISKVKEYKFVNQLIRFHEYNVDEIIKYVDEIIKEKIKDIKKDEEIKALSYYKIESWEWINLTDCDVIYYSDMLFEELVKEKYDTRYFKNIIIFLLQLDKHFKQKKSQLAHNNAEYISLMEKYIQEHDCPSDLPDRLELWGVDDIEFINQYNECIEPLISSFKCKEDNKQQNINLELFSTDNWAEKFHEYCKANHDVFLHSNAFLYSFPIDRILEKLRCANNQQVRTFILAICSVYDFENIRDFYQADVNKLKMIIELLQSMAKDENCDCTKKLVLEIYTERLMLKCKALT